MASILLSKLDFSLVSGTGKRVYESKSGKEYCENCGQGGRQFDSGEVNPHDSVKSENYFENYGQRIESMGHIELHKPNPAHMVGSGCTQLGWNYLNQIRSR